MNEQDKHRLTFLIPRWNDGDRTAINEVAKIVEPWVRGFASLAIDKEHESVMVASKKIPTILGMWDVNEQTQEVMVRFAIHQNSVTKLTTPLALYQLLRFMTYRILKNKIEAITKQSENRVSVSAMDPEEQDLMEGAANKQNASDMVTLLEHLEHINIKHPDMAMAYAMHHIDGHTTQEISDITGQTVRSIQRNIKLVNTELYAHLMTIKTEAS